MDDARTLLERTDLGFISHLPDAALNHLIQGLQAAQSAVDAAMRVLVSRIVSLHEERALLLQRVRSSWSDEEVTAADQEYRSDKFGVGREHDVDLAISAWACTGAAGYRGYFTRVRGTRTFTDFSFRHPMQATDFASLMQRGETPEVVVQDKDNHVLWYGDGRDLDSRCGCESEWLSMTVGEVRRDVPSTFGPLTIHRLSRRTY